MKLKIALFLSGSGSNARNICSYFKNHEQIEVSIILSNKENSGAKHVSAEFDIPYFIFTRAEFYDTSIVAEELKKNKIDTLVLAGFLWLIPTYLLAQFPNQIINIHPALLPKYGGKGMHGKHVHEAVFSNNEKESGITIHLCNKEYDKGEILFQAKVSLTKEDNPESIAAKVLQLEHQHFPLVIEKYMLAK